MPGALAREARATRCSNRSARGRWPTSVFKCVLRVPCLDCTLPCTLPCTPPLHSSFLHSFYRFFPIVFLRNSFSLFSDRFSAGCFLSCCFSEGNLVDGRLPLAPRGWGIAAQLDPPDPGERSFFASIFGHRFLTHFIDF